MLIKIIAVLFILSSAYMHFRGRVRHSLHKQVFDHSSFTAPVNLFMLLFSGVPRTAYLDPTRFPELNELQSHWQEIREEALALESQIKAAGQHDDAGFNSFFKTGWKRFYLKWYGDAHPSARTLCPKTTEILSRLPSVKAAMFAHLPHGAKLGKHRDPYAGSLRYHLGLVTPNDTSCFIEVDGERYSWKDGEGVVFDETFIHFAENKSGQDRIVLFCDIERPMRFRFAQAINHWIGTHVLSAASSPNEASDPTGAINRVFRYAHYIGQKRRAFKAWNRNVYQATRILLIVAVIALIIYI